MAQSSAPLKKRSKLLSSSSDNDSQASSEHAAAAALAELNQSLGDGKTRDQSNGHTSDSESVSSNDSSVVPKAVHKPPVSNMMVDHTYTDYSVVKEDLLSYLNSSEDDDDSESELSNDERKMKEKALRRIRKIFGDISPTRKNSGGVVKPFPEKLMEVLDRGDMDNIITWLPHGRAFIVRHAQQLREIVLPRFFKQSKFMSFTRQLNLWGFKRITKGTDAGAYYHELFLRGRPRLSMLMRRQKIKGTGIKLTPNPETEPNFYNISQKRPLPAIPQDKKKLEPLPPISNSVSVTRNSKPPMSSTSASYNNNNSMRHNIDLYLQQIEQQKNLSNFSQNQSLMDQQSRMQMGSSRMMPPLPQQRLSFQDAYSTIDMLGHGGQSQGHRPFQRLSAPTTQADFMNTAVSAVRSSSNEQEQAMSSAEQLLREVGGRQPAPSNPVEDLKQKLLNAVHSLEQAQASQQPQRDQIPYSSAAMYRNPREQNISLSAMNQYQSLLPQNNFMMQQQQNNLLSQQQQQQHNLFGQSASRHEPSPPQESSSISALMSALDQTRQVAAAAQAQSNLLQRVANDLALGRHLNKK